MLIFESWISGRDIEHTDYMIKEHTGNNIYMFYLPWYACFEGEEDNELFIGLDDVGCNTMRSSTMLEF